MTNTQTAVLLSFKEYAKARRLFKKGNEFVKEKRCLVCKEVLIKKKNHNFYTWGTKKFCSNSCNAVFIYIKRAMEGIYDFDYVLDNVVEDMNNEKDLLSGKLPKNVSGKDMSDKMRNRKLYE